MSCGDAVAFGLASAHVPSQRFAALAQRLVDGEDVSAAIEAESAPPPASALAVKAFHRRLFRGADAFSYSGRDRRRGLWRLGIRPRDI